MLISSISLVFDSYICLVFHSFILLHIYIYIYINCFILLYTYFKFIHVKALLIILMLKGAILSQ